MKGAAPLFVALRILRAPLLSVCVFVAAVAFPDQSLEIYRAALDSPRDSAWIIATSLAAVLLLCFAVSRSCDRLIAASELAASLRPVEPLAIVISLGPAFGLAAGFSKAAWEDKAPISSAHDLALYGAAIALMGVALGLEYLRRSRQASRQDRTGVEAQADARHPWGGRVLVLTALLLLVVGTVVCMPLSAAALLGPVASLALFCFFLLTFLSVFDRIYALRGIPVVTCLAVVAMVSSCLEWNNNHWIRDLPADSKADPPLKLADAFSKWVEERKDIHHFRDKGRPYPVYIVSAEGGGIYAALHAAATLGRLQDSCPRFAQHLFAISGVSGGSVGSALFAAAASRSARNEKDLGCEPLTRNGGDFQTLAAEFFENDFLTPVVLGALFPDFLQLFLPFPVGPFDRARLLERGFEAAWARSFPPPAPNPFEQSFRGLWKPDKAIPALVLNTTSTMMGGREFIAPFKVEFETLVLAPQSQNFVGAEIDLRLSTAAGLSARFPWVTPPATLGKYKVQVADGGYFENSGAETAHNIVQELQRTFPISSAAGSQPRGSGSPDPNGLELQIGGRRVPVSLKLLTIRAEDVPAFREQSGEILAPIRTLLSARQAHGAHSFRKAFFAACPECSPEKMTANDTIRTQTLSFQEESFPLGWFLALANRKRIQRAIGDNRHCKLSSAVFRYSVEAVNHCLYDYVRRDLSY